MSRSSIILVLGGLIFILLVNSIFIVNEKEKALVTQFGEVIRPDVPVGLHLKLPIIQNVEKFDARLQSLDEEPDRILTIESKYLLVDSFVKYRIVDVLTFYTATSGSFLTLNNLLGQRTEFELKNQFGKRTITELVSGERDEMMKSMTMNLTSSVSDLGVEIIDFRVKRIDLPTELSNSVFERMRTERYRLAEELRAEGKEISDEIKSKAEKEKVQAVVYEVSAELYKQNPEAAQEAAQQAPGRHAAVVLSMAVASISALLRCSWQPQCAIRRADRLPHSMCGHCV